MFELCSFHQGRIKILIFTECAHPFVTGIPSDLDPVLVFHCKSSKNVSRLVADHRSKVQYGREVVYITFDGLV